MDINRPVFFSAIKSEFFMCKDDPTMPQNWFTVLYTTLPMIIGKRGKVEHRGLDPDTLNCSPGSRHRPSPGQRPRSTLWHLGTSQLPEEWPWAGHPADKHCICIAQNHTRGWAGLLFLMEILRNVLHCYLSINKTFVLKRIPWLQEENEPFLSRS